MAEIKLFAFSRFPLQKTKQIITKFGFLKNGTHDFRTPSSTCIHGYLLDHAGDESSFVKVLRSSKRVKLFLDACTIHTSYDTTKVLL